MIDYFNVRKSDKNNDWGPGWEDSPFTPDYLSQTNNNYDAIRPGDRYEEYSNPDTQRRVKTRAPEMFDYFDIQDGPLEEPGSFVIATGKLRRSRPISR